MKTTVLRKMLGRKVYWTWFCAECGQEGTMFKYESYARAVLDAHTENHRDMDALARIYSMI